MSQATTELNVTAQHTLTIREALADLGNVNQVGAPELLWIPLRRSVSH